MAAKKRARRDWSSGERSGSGVVDMKLVVAESAHGARGTAGIVAG